MLKKESNDTTQKIMCHGYGLKTMDHYENLSHTRNKTHMFLSNKDTYLESVIVSQIYVFYGVSLFSLKS